MTNIKLLCFFVMIEIVYSEVSIQDQLEHVMKRRQESQGLANDIIKKKLFNRRFNYKFDGNEVSEIIGAPSLPSHLPESEPILPGHTLIRPALGMLKSSIKFPHRELENGAGVLGNYNSLSIKYDGRNERVLYTNFRRNSPCLGTRRMASYDTPYKNTRRKLADYIMVLPSMKHSKPTFSLSNLVLDLDKEEDAQNKVLKRLKYMKHPVKKNKRLIMFVADPTVLPLHLKDLIKDRSTEIEI